jgi:hypothetical protein
MLNRIYKDMIITCFDYDFLQQKHNNFIQITRYIRL